MAITSRMANGTDTKTCHEQIGDTATRLPINNHGTSLTPEKRTSLAIADSPPLMQNKTATTSKIAKRLSKGFFIVGPIKVLNDLSQSESPQQDVCDFR